MKNLVGTIVPSMIVLAAVGWAVWPYLESPGLSPTSKTRDVEVSSALLAWVAGRTPDRDPFRSPSVPAAVGSTRAPRPGPGEKVPKAGLANTMLEARRAEVDVRATLPGKVALSATSIHGTRRMAVLNGRVYAEGESVQGIDAPNPVVLAAIHPASVRLCYGGESVAIAFSAASAATRSPPSQPQQNRKRGAASKSNFAPKPTRPR